MKLLQILMFVCIATMAFAQENAPIDDIVERTITTEKRILPFEKLDERDIFWSKKVWRVIDVREKMNQPFMYPQKPFFDIVTQAVLSGDLTAYSSEKDDFSLPLAPEEINGLLVKMDTVEIYDENFMHRLQVVQEDIWYEDIKRFRVKEVWYVDSKSSQMKVRILGIAPLREVYNEQGVFLYETPLYWVYYPHARELLAREECFVAGNDSAPTTWDDIFTTRQFSSTVYKGSNVLDQKLEALYSGTDRLLVAEKIEAEIFNYEHDMWSF